MLLSLLWSMFANLPVPVLMPPGDGSSVNTWWLPFFAAFSGETEKYYAEVVKQGEAWKAHREEAAEMLVKYVRSLKKKEARDKLLEVLEYGPEWQWERFVSAPK